MKLFLEKTTGLLVPTGVLVALPRDTVTVELQFLASSVAELVAGGAVSLKLYAPDDLVTPVATFDTWTEDAANVRYTRSLDVLTALGSSPLPTYLARIEYGAGPTLSNRFHVEIGDADYRAALAATTISITVNTGGGGGGAVQSGSAALAANAKSGTVAFSPALGATPGEVRAWIEPPGGTGAALAVSTHTISAAGFSWLATGKTPDALHVLKWKAYT